MRGKEKKRLPQSAVHFAGKNKIFFLHGGKFAAKTESIPIKKPISR